MRRVFHTTIVALACLALTNVGMAPPVMAADPADESQDFRFPGADTIALHDGSNKYITYGATVKPSGGDRIWVPYSITGSGNQIATSPVIDGDAMENGPGAWADRDVNIWSPGAWYHIKDGVGRYYLFYTAKHRERDQRCIGVARSRTPTTGFIAEPTPIACPDRDRWALDADIFQGPEGAIWMTWRDGQRAEGPESAISVMMLKFQTDGTVDRGGTPVVILRSNNLDWPRYRDGSGVVVIENPSAVYRNGSFYLFYSGNKWETNLYATGIAHCGNRIDDGLCAPMPGPRRAWFSYTGPLECLPPDMRKYGLPGNKRGPGAMDVHRARDGQLWVTWNYLTGDTGDARKSRVGILNVTGSGPLADFRVTLPQGGM